MNKLPSMPRWAVILCLAALMPALTWAQDDAKVRKDLTTVIALQGKPCGEVIEVERRDESDYRVTCRTGDRYRVYVDANDRVVIEDID